jgi:MFS transporter, ACS family, hexuronate transporter
MASPAVAAALLDPTVRPVRWVYAVLLLLVSVLNYIDRQTLSVLAVTIQREMHLSDVRYGYVVQCFLLTYMVMYVASGRLVDRFRPRRTQGAFVLGWSAASVLTGLATGFVSLAAFRALLGVAEPGNYTASLRAVGDWFSAKQRAIAIGIYSMGGTLGAAIAVPLTAMLALRFGWRAAFFVPGAFGLFVTAIWYAIYRDPVVSSRESVPAMPWRQVIRQPYIVAMVGTRMMTDTVWYFFLFWVPKYMQESHGLSLGMVGKTLWILYVAADFGSILGGVASSWFVPRRGAVGGRFAVMIPTAVCMLALSVVPRIVNTTSVVVVLSLLATCHMAWMTNITTMTLDLFPSHTVATVQGLIGAASAAGGLISAGLIAFTTQTHGYTSIFICLALMHPLAMMILRVNVRPAHRFSRPISVETN